MCTGYFKKINSITGKNFEELLIKNKEIKFDFYGFNNRQPIWAEDFKNQLSNSKMDWILERKPLKYYSSDRIAQLMGNGLLTFIDETSYSDFLQKGDNNLQKCIWFNWENSKI